MNKKKIINDPVYGFVKIQSDLIYDLIEHPYFQRLRRIKQLGLAEFIYPGAIHTRFHHALGAMHLMGTALDALRSKNYLISEDEFEAAQIAILLHDIGHGPMSHALEATILSNVAHESLSNLLMLKLNEFYGGRLTMAIAMFQDNYPRKFFHQLISSQLDIDRLDYLQRDCFFTGVSEGTIGAERIIKMLAIHNDEIVVEEKGIYSIENFLTARRLMYWQVYLHKTNISADRMLIQLIKRAKYLAQKGEKIFATPYLAVFFDKNITMQDFSEHIEYLEAFASLDDYDIWACMKVWMGHSDYVLSRISKMLLNRKLFRVILSGEKPDKDFYHDKKDEIAQKLKISDEEAQYFIVKGSTSNEAYLAKGQKINILTKKGEVLDIAKASDLPNIKALRKIVKKYYVCWYKPTEGLKI